MKKLLLPIILLGLIIFGFFGIQKSHADELDDLTKQINELQSALSNSINATKPLESELTSMQNQIGGIKQRVAGIEADIAEKRKIINTSYATLADKQKILNQTIREFYIQSSYNSPFSLFLSAANAQQLTQSLAYQRATTNQNKLIITNIALSIADLENKKKNLEAEQSKLTTLKKTLDVQSEKLDKVITDAKNYQTQLTGKIAELSAKQQSILNARSGSFTASIGDSELADDYNASIKGFRESAPSGSFAAFSFGAFTHRKGMSQYGARGRASQGQGYQQILKAYFGKEAVNKDTGGNIKVSGTGELDFEGKYLYGIAEMPSSWPKEALKAQAIAARTYAYRYKSQGSEICTTEACQVYLQNKADNPPEAWKQAVDETKGQVIEDVITYFSSTTGGFLTTSGWDTTNTQGGSDFISRAYEKIGGSPWLYKAWYTKGYSTASDKCGKANPWLNRQEMADIVNAALVLSKGSGNETERITPVTTSCWGGGNPYSMDELANVASKYGGLRSADSVTVIQGNGTTNEVRVNGLSIPGDTFKKAFNLRAPGFLSIPQSGFTFFNIESK